MAKVTLCTDWLDVCSGCHMSLARYRRGAGSIWLENVQLLSTPITDLKHPPVEGCDVGILTGAVLNDHQEAGRQADARALQDPHLDGRLRRVRRHLHHAQLFRCRGGAALRLCRDREHGAGPEGARSPEIAKLFPTGQGRCIEVVKVDLLHPWLPSASNCHLVCHHRIARWTDARVDGRPADVRLS